MHCAFQHRFLKVICLLCLLGCAHGCGFFSEETGGTNGAQQMEVLVQFQDVHRCSFMSPEIRVLHPPKGTAVYDVELVEKNGAQETVLGKGSWQEDGTGVIPEGALTGHYRGPCPPAGARREYFFMISARKEKDPKPLAISIFSFVLE